MVTFSILYRIELAVTGVAHRFPCGQVSFSILYRIELAVTLAVTIHLWLSQVFQYPLSDRTRCNGG